MNAPSEKRTPFDGWLDPMWVHGGTHGEDIWGITPIAEYSEISVADAFLLGGLFWRGEGRYVLADATVELI